VSDALPQPAESTPPPPGCWATLTRAWATVRNTGIHADLSPSLQRPIQLTNLAALFAIFTFVPWIPVRWMEGHPRAALTLLVAAGLGFPAVLRLNAARRYTLSRVLFLIALNLAYAVGTTLSPTSAGMAELALSINVLTAMMFRQQERVLFAVMSVLPVAIFVGSSWWWAPPEPVDPSAVLGERIAVVASCLFVVGGLLRSQRLDQEAVRDALSQLRLARLANVQAAAAAARAAEESQAAAEDVSNAKTAFLASMSHEVRTPLNGVLGMASLLQITNLNADQQEMVNTIDQSGRALLTILDDILDFSRMESGTLELDSEPFEPEAVARRAAALFDARARAKELTIRVEGTTPPVHGDAVRWQQVLLNLVGNALKFTTRGEIVVRLSAHRQGDQLSLTAAVRDTGIGMSEDALQRLFRPFEQADASTTRKYGGTGLGLAISQRLAHAMGGAISVTSAVGVGSEFVLTTLHNASTAVPRPEADPDADPGRPGDASGLRVLVAEDNVVNARIVSKMLQSLGTADILVVPDGRAALRALEFDGEFDLVLMDVEMPDIDGLEATRQWREIERACGIARVRIVALTANVFADDRAMAESAGMDDYLTKPLQRTALQRILAEAKPDLVGA
jgi:signal transduction histidine kinase